MIDRRRPSVAIDSNLKPTRFRDLSDSAMESALQINRDALEEACCTHPELLHEVSNRLAILISKRDESRQTLKEVEAKADAEIRHDAEVSGDKITEKVVESQKMVHNKVKAARDGAFEFEKQCGQMTALKEAFYARGFAIRDLIQLHIANYYGSDMEKSGRDMRSSNADTARKEQSKNFRR